MAYNIAASAKAPAPMAPSPTANWFAAPVGLAVALAADWLAALAADEAADDALATTELTEAEMLEATELTEALTLEARLEASEAAEDAALEASLVADPAAPPAPVALAIAALWPEVQVAAAGCKESWSVTGLDEDGLQTRTKSEEADTGSQMLWA
jgi:hypothetical protein